MAIVYTPTEWKNRVVKRPRTYTQKTNEDGSVTLAPAPGEIYEAGTPLNEENMNHIEQGIASCANAIREADDKFMGILADHVLVFTNLVIATSAWTADSTYEDYPYAAGIVCTGVTTQHMPTVVFDAADAASGKYAAVAKSGSGTITVYATEVPEAAITIPTIMCVKAVEQ